MRALSTILLVILHAATASADRKYDAAPQLDGDPVAAKALIYRLNQLAMACEDGRFRGRIVVEAAIDATGQLTSLTTAPASRAVAQCFESALRRSRLPASSGGATVRRPFAFAGCNPFKLEDRADREVATGRFAAALRSYEGAFACDDGLVQHEVEHSKAFLAACLAGDAARADHYHRLLPAAERARLAPLCHRIALPATSGLPPAPSGYSGCDTAKMVEVAEREVKAGKLAFAVRQFSDTLRCGVDRDIALRATAVACEAGSAIYAMMFFAMIAPADRAPVAAACSKLGVTTMP